MDVLVWEDGGLRLLDQTRLPHEVSYLLCTSYQEVAEAIHKLQVRGAPAIGIAAAFGYALAALNFAGQERQKLTEQLQVAAARLRAARPTAVNLGWAVDRMEAAYRRVQGLPLGRIQALLLEEARQILREERQCDAAISSLGAELIPAGARVLTYCNTGALATAGAGTALGVILKAHRQGKGIQVYASETRPVLQGARLTVWELDQAGVPYTLITDNMAGYLFRRGELDLVIVGADRIVANGDFANKIGTYSLAVLAAYHQRPFYVAAPSSTIDLSLSSGEEIPVEMRDPDEVRRVGGQPVTLAGCPVLNPSFDITPHELVTAYITERGVLKPPLGGRV